jgi:hypothetical protein
VAIKLNASEKRDRSELEDALKIALNLLRTIEVRQNYLPLKKKKDNIVITHPH